MKKQKKLLSLSHEAITKLQSLSNKCNLNNSQVVEALIILANEENIKININVKKEYLYKIEKAE